MGRRRDLGNYAGKVLQVVRGGLATKFASSATATYVDITGLTASITPTSADSKVLVHVTIWTGGANDAYPMYRLLRGSTEIGSGTSNSGSNNVNVLAGGFFGAGGAHIQYTQKCLNRHFLDSPSSASEVTYKIQGKNAYTGGAAGIVYVNRAENDGDNLFAGCTHSELVLMEVAA